MSRTREQGSVVGGQGSGVTRRSSVAFVALVMALFFAGCRQDMHDQPRYKTYAASPFFADGQASRPAVRGAVARGTLAEDSLLYTGKLDAQAAQSLGQPQPQAVAETVPGLGPSAPAPDKTGQGFANLFPFPVTAEVLDRGETNYNVFCAVCHDRLGTGDGMIVRRGYRRPPSYHIDRLRQAPAGYLFDVITNGFGAMPDYAAQINPADRWAIVAYIRVLQISQSGTIEDVPADKRGELEKGRRQQ
jgi:mono/diheme cytochrome c family protein